MKKIISLVLFLMVCFGLMACETELPGEYATLVCGTWYHDGDGDCPGYLRLNKDGTAGYNGAGGYTWTGTKDREEPVVHVTLQNETNEKHSFDVRIGHSDDTEGWLTMEKDGPSWCYRKVNTACGVSWFEEAMTVWYPQEEDAVAQSVTLHADGTAKMDGKRFFWSVAEADGSADGMFSLLLFNEQGTGYIVDLNRQENGLYHLRVHDRRQGSVSGYFAHPLVKLVGSGSWESIDRYTMIVESFSADPRQEAAVIADGEYHIRFDTKASQEELVVHFMEGDVLRYEAYIFMDGEYPMATLTDQQSGQQTLYYNRDCGYDPANPEAAYFNALNLVYQYANGSAICHLETGEELEEDEYLPYIYEKLTELGDYKQAKEFLARFTVVPSKLTEQTLYATDSQGNSHSSWVNRYGYDENGVMIWAVGEDIPEMYGLYDTSNPQTFTYDAKGRIAEVRISDAAAEAVGTPIFDTLNKVVGMTVKHGDEDNTSVFTYGTGARVIRLEIPEADYGCSRKYEYTYDDAGKLITKVLTLWEGRQIITSSYIYDGDFLVEIRQTRCDWEDEYHWTYAYTNDEQGRPLSAVITTDDPEVTYQTQEYRYIYEDLYFFDASGLVTEG